MKAKLKTDDLKRIVKATAKFVYKGDHRPILEWIRLQFNKEDMSVKAVALDGYKVSIESVTCIDIDESFTAYIRPFLPVGAKCDYASLELSDGMCLINIDGRMTGYMQPSGDYIDADKIVADIEAIPVTREVYLTKELIVDALNSLQPDMKLIRQPVIIQLRDGYQAISVRMGKSTRHVLPIRK